MFFINRNDAGNQLADRLQEYRNKKDTIVIALPRGGVVVGFQVATALNLPLDIVTPRKIGAPFNPELAIGAITETGESILSTEWVGSMNITPEYLNAAMQEGMAQARWRLDHYRKNRAARQVEGKRVLLVDDGLATGSTMKAAIKTMQHEKAKEIIVAVPVAPPDTVFSLRQVVNQVICLYSPNNFYAVGQFYENFEQTTDEEVIGLLEKSL